MLQYPPKHTMKVHSNFDWTGIDRKKRQVYNVGIMQNRGLGYAGFFS